MRVLWLLPDLGYSAAARQACLAVPEFTRLGHDVSVAVMRSGGGLSPLLRSAGVTVHELSSPQDIPLRALHGLQRLLGRDSFEVIHAWRLPALRAVTGLRLGGAHRARLVASQPRRGGRWTPVDRLLLARVDVLTVDWGEPADGRPDTPMAVETPAPQSDWDLQLPADARMVLCLGALTGDHGFRDAIWAFDVLKFVYTNLELVVVGDGPQRERLAQFARSIANARPKVHFCPGRLDGPSLLRRAEVVWVPSRRPCGEQVVLEAQAAGVPVVATALPGLSAVIQHGSTGVLSPVGDPVALAKATRPVLDDPDYRAKLATNGRDLRSGRHHAADIARQWTEVYAGCAS